MKFKFEITYSQIRPFLLIVLGFVSSVILNVTKDYIGYLPGILLISVFIAAAIVFDIDMK